uniref:Uncharacterized protein n=1 Tax=Populus alba TaxID=43335 RepID=A0A4U5P6F4_POPAL|nr:hypothetical protein D5086_0000219700 [Populus alba]
MPHKRGLIILSNSYMEIISVLVPPSCGSFFHIAFIAAGSNISSIRDDVNLSQDCSLDSSLQQLAQLTAPFRFRYMGSGVSGSLPEVRPPQSFQVLPIRTLLC